MQLDNTFSILGSRDKRLEGYSYKLSTGGYGLDTAVASGEPEVSEGEMSFWLTFADGQRRDGVGDLLEVSGIDVSRHRKNPLALFDHAKSVVLPIGTCEDPKTRAYTVTIDPMEKVAKAKVFVYQDSAKSDHAVFCEQLFDLWTKRFLRAGSIGYQVIQAQQMGPDYEKGVQAGLHLQKVLMLECSAVVPPANGDTVRKTLALPQVCGKPLSPYLVKSLTPYADSKPVQVVSGFKSEAIPGGLSSGKNPTDFDPEQLAAGIKVEMEHTDDPDVAREIAMDHLVEDSSYYRKLSVMESKAQPSSDISPDKACQILHDGEANGKPLTDKQRGMFGAACGRKKSVKELRVKYSRKALEVAWISGRQTVLGEVIDDSGTRYIVRVISATPPRGQYKPGNKVSVPKEQCQVMGGSKAHQHGGRGGGMVPNRYDPLTNPIVVGDTVIAREGLVDPKTRVMLRSGERVQVIADAEGGAMIEVRNSAGETSRHLRSSFRKKSLEDKFTRDDSGKFASGKRREHSGFRKQEAMEKRERKEASKSIALGAVRKKYRSVKSVRRRLKKSAPGSSMVYVRGKDLEAFQTAATAKGLKVARLGVKGSLEKVRLTGDDAVIDSVAKEYGQSSRRGVKSMPANVKILNGKTKDMTPGDQPPPEADLNKDGEVTGEEMEKYGAQCLRRLHEDFSILMQDYDEMTQMLENEQVSAHLTKILEQLEENLTGTEELFSEAYSELDGLGDGEGEEVESKDMDTMDDNAVPAADDEAEEPTPEEALEGMANAEEEAEDIDDGSDRKSLTKVQKKALRGRYRKKGLCGKCSGKKDLTEAEADDISGDVLREVEDTEEKPLADYEMKSVGDAAGFLGEVGETQEFGDEHRFKSYHYHKTLEGIAGLQEAHRELAETPTGQDVPPAEFEPGVGAIKATPGSEEWAEEEMTEPEHQGEMGAVGMKMSGRKAIGEASGFLGELSRTQDFGDEHRARAKEFNLTLNDVINPPVEEVMVQEDIAESDPGQNVDVKTLKSTFLKQQKAMAEMNKQLAALKW